MDLFGSTVLVSGHRGDRVHGLENTMTAMLQHLRATGQHP